MSTDTDLSYNYERLSNGYSLLPRPMLPPPPPSGANDTASMCSIAEASHDTVPQAGAREFQATSHSFLGPSASDTGYQSQMASTCFMDDMSTVQGEEEINLTPIDENSPKRNQSEWVPPSSSTPNKVQVAITAADGTD